MSLVSFGQGHPDTRGHARVQIGQRLDVRSTQREQTWKGSVGRVLKGLDDRVVGLKDPVKSQELKNVIICLVNLKDWGSQHGATRASRSASGSRGRGPSGPGGSRGCSRTLSSRAAGISTSRHVGQAEKESDNQPRSSGSVR